jgi:serine O-acetyltransferase
MIKTKEQLKHIIQVEEKIYGKKWYYNLPFHLTENQILYKHMIYLRKTEYYLNNNKKLLRYWYHVKLLRLQTRYAILIPLNTVDEGLNIVHLQSVMVNNKAKIGKNCRLMPGSMVAANHDKAPVIGDNVYIGPGAKVFGDIEIADDVQIGANAVVNKSCTQKGAILVGVPAKVVGGVQ